MVHFQVSPARIWPILLLTKFEWIQVRDKVVDKVGTAMAAVAKFAVPTPWDGTLKE